MNPPDSIPTPSSKADTDHLSSAFFASESSSTAMILGRILWQLTKISSGFVAILLVILYVKQESLLYFPSIGGMPRRPSQNPRRYRSPAEYDLPYESHRITTSDGVNIHLWLLYQPSSSAPTILFFHGNAGNIGLRLPNAHQMYHQLKAHVVLVEYRGYGDSDDHVPITEQGLKRDAQAAWEFIRRHPKIDPSCIFLFGRSLGGAVALDLARYIEDQEEEKEEEERIHRKKDVTTGMMTDRPIPRLMGVMVENTFLSIGHMVNALMPFLAPFKFLILRMDWNNEQHLHALKTPVLFLAGDQDELVPHSHMQRLHQLALIKSKLAKMHIIRGGTHNDSWLKGGMEYYSQMREFMNHAMMVHQGDDDGPNRNNTCISSSFHPILSSDDTTPSIPIMPRNILSMAKEASASLTSTSNNTRDAGSKKKE